MRSNMKRLGRAGCALVASLLSAVGSAATVDPVFNRALDDLPDREVTMITVAYAPGEASPLHRHNAHTLVYVLQGSIVMQVQDGPLTTLGPGGVFYESPDDVHTVSRNASDTEGAKFLVYFLKQKGAPPTVSAD